LDGIFAAFFTYLVTREFGPEDVKVYTFNTKCTISNDKKTIELDAGFLLKSDRFDAMLLTKDYIYANINDQGAALNKGEDLPVILLKDKIVHATMKGNFHPQIVLQR